MARTFGVHLSPADPVAWPAKVRSIARDEYHFWRGTRDLFYGWSAVHCRDWYQDAPAITVSHGDLHLGNLGTYAAAGRFGTLVWGMVDFDESARLPFQLELLQGVVTFELIAQDNGWPLRAGDQTRLRETIFDTYAATLDRHAGGGEPAATDAGPALSALVKARAAQPYADDLTRFTHDGRFRETVVKKNVTTDLLRPLPAAERSSVAHGLAEAVQHDGRLAAILRPYDAADFEHVILDIAERTRLDSSGSQGLVKLLLLLRRPFRGHDFDGLIYLKQQLPSAAERVGAVSAVEGSPGRRYVRDLDTLTHRQALAASWCEIGGRSFWVSIKEPWSDEPESKEIADVEELIAAARAWTRVAADSHRADAPRLRPLLTPATRAAVIERAHFYLAWQAKAFVELKADLRTDEAIGAAGREVLFTGR